MQHTDIVIVGAGIAGASLAYRLAGLRSVVLLEREAQPGMHSTGRSAAMFEATYGPPAVRALTRASRDFYLHPPSGFGNSPLLAPRGLLYVAMQGQETLLAQMHEELRVDCPALQRLSAADAITRVPVLNAERLVGALWEPEACDIDVHALHQGYLRGARQAGAALRCDAGLLRAHHDGTRWQLTLADGSLLAATTVVNAAGAWADEVAALCGAKPVGLVPKRRSAFTFAPPPGLDVSGWPCVIGIDESYYFKPDAGRLLGSPANADPMHAHDVMPEDIDIATGIHQIEDATTLRIRRPTSTWAGLRSFVADGELVIGPDDACPGFFWLAAQGGYGIQSAAGVSALAAALLCGQTLPEVLAQEGVEPARVSVQRLR
jgi:D-arginine dehydrogenase